MTDMLEGFPFLEHEAEQADARRLVMARGLKAHPHFAQLIEAETSPAPWLGDLIESLDHRHVTRGTPYFWRFLRQVLTIRSPGPAMDSALSQLAFAALDLAAGERGLEHFGALPLPAVHELQLLRCGVTGRGGDHFASARLVGGGVALIAASGAVLRVEAPTAGSQYPPFRTVALESVDLGNSHGQLERAEDALSTLRYSLVHAFHWIAGVSEPIAALIKQEAHFVSPLRRGPSVHFSFTLSDLPGMIFIGGSDHLLTIVEAIVHETGHARLHHANERFPLCLGADRATYYSPWRGDPRPATGVLHGAYVFSLVLGFWIVALERAAALTDSEREYIVGRVAAVRVQLELAFQVLQKAELSPFGVQLLQQLQSILPCTRAFVGQKAEEAAHAAALSKISRARAEHPELVMP
jgi:HEXXH motif-containing protein